MKKILSSLIFLICLVVVTFALSNIGSALFDMGEFIKKSFGTIEHYWLLVFGMLLYLTIAPLMAIFGKKMLVPKLIVWGVYMASISYVLFAHQGFNTRAGEFDVTFTICMVAALLIGLIILIIDFYSEFRKAKAYELREGEILEKVDEMYKYFLKATVENRGITGQSAEEVEEIEEVADEVEELEEVADEVEEIEEVADEVEELEEVIDEVEELEEVADEVEELEEVIDEVEELEEVIDEVEELEEVADEVEELEEVIDEVEELEEVIDEVEEIEEVIDEVEELEEVIDEVEEIEEVADEVEEVEEVIDEVDELEEVIDEVVVPPSDIVSEVAADSQLLTKSDIANLINDKYSENFKINKHPIATKTGLPIPDTYYIIKENAEGVMTEYCFAYVYQLNDKIKIIAKLTKSLAEAIGDNTRSKFPIGKQWYKFVVSPKNSEKILSIIETSKKFTQDEMQDGNIKGYSH